jgi:hypothetical protein
VTPIAEVLELIEEEIPNRAIRRCDVRDQHHAIIH